MSRPGRLARFEGRWKGVIHSHRLAADTALPMCDADAALSGGIRRRLENALELRDRASDGAMGTHLRRILVEHLEQSVLTRRSGQSFSVSRRTLTRRLAEEGTSFRHILDEVRCDLARGLLQGPA